MPSNMCNHAAETIGSCQRLLQASWTIPSNRPTEQPSSWAHLPDEILVCICEEVRNVYHPHLDIPTENSRWVRWEPGWLVLTRICHSWRSIIFRTPALYANIPRASPLWLEDFIRRSRDVRMSVDLNLDPNHRGRKVTKRQRRSLQLLVNNLHRVDELTIAGYQAYDFLSMAVEPAPNLHTLRLHAKQDHQMSHSATMRPNFRFPPNLFQGRLPNLRHLVLSDIPALDMLPLLTENVTKLELTRDYHSACPLSVPPIPLLLALRRMPHLTLLSLVNVLEPFSESGQPTNLDEIEPVDLPDLSDLSIYCRGYTDNTHTRLLEKLRFDQSSVRLHIGAECHIPFPVAFPAYITSPPTSLPPFRAFKLLVSEIPPGLTLAGWRTPPAHRSALQSLPSAAFSADLRSAHHTQCPCGAHLHLHYHPIPLPAVQLLSLGWRDSHAANASTYACLLAHFPALTCIELDYRCSSVEASGLLGGLVRADWNGHLLCPELREVHLEHTPTLAEHCAGSRDFDALVKDVAARRRRFDCRSKLAEVVVLGRRIRCGTPDEIRAIREGEGYVDSGV